MYLLFLFSIFIYWDGMVWHGMFRVVPFAFSVEKSTPDGKKYASGAGALVTNHSYGKLRKIVEEETKGKGWSVKVIERAGIKLQHQVPGLKEPDSCGKADCFIHTTGGKGD